MNLNELRAEIDVVDGQLLELLARRWQLIEQVADYKRQHDLPALQPERFQSMLEARRATAQELGLPEELVTKVWEAIHEASVHTQQDRV